MRHTARITTAAALLAAVLLAVPAAGEESVAVLLEEAFTQLAAGELEAARPRIEKALELAERDGDLRGQGQALFLAGVIQSQGKSFDEALVAYGRSYEILNESGDRFGAWLVLTSHGEALRLAERPEEALAALERSVKALHEMGTSGESISLDSFKMFARSQSFPREVFDSVEPFLAIMQPILLRMAEAMTLTRIAAVQEDKGAKEEAIASLDRALELSQPFGLMDGSILHDKAAIKAALGMLDESAADYETALAKARQIFDRPLQMKILAALAEVETLRGQEDAALGVYGQLLEIVRQTGEREREPVVLNDMGWLYDRQHRYDEARSHYEAAIRVAREVGDRANEATSLNNLAALFVSLGRPEESLPLLGESLGLARELEDPEQVGVTLDTLAEAHRLLGRSEAALACLEESLKIAVEIGNTELEASVRNNLSVLFLGLSRFQEALLHQRRSLELAEQLDNRQGQALAILNLASIYMYLDHDEEAYNHLRKAMALTRQLADPILEKNVYGRQALLELEMGRHEAARELFDTAREISRRLGDEPGELEALNAMAMVDAVHGPFERALPLLYEILARTSEAALPEAEACARLTLGLVKLQLGERSEAISELEAATTTFDEAGLSYGKALALGLAGVVRYLEKQPGTALRDLEHSAAELDAIREGIGVEELTAAFAAKVPHSIYYALVFLAVQEGRAEDAFAYSERSRARAFLKQLGNQRIRLRDTAPGELLERERQLRRRMAALEEQIREETSFAFRTSPLRDALREARRDYRSLRLELAENHPETASLVRVDTIELEEVQTEILDDATTLVAYYVGGRQTLVWVVDRESAKLVQLDLPAGELRQQVSHLAATIRGRGFDFANAGDLYQKLFEPLLPHVRHRNLILVPHGVLHRLPFAALWNSRAKRFLVEDYALTHVPSASVLRHLAAKRTAYQGRALVLGNPDGSLPHAASEAEAVARLHGAPAWLREHASEDRVWRDAGKADVLHLAAHAVFDGANPLFSRVELAPGGEHDGSLEVHEVFGLDLAETDLVVLSGCETALGEQTAGDEIVGLTRAFLYAGSPAVMTSLWSVDDEASGALMESFYRNLRSAPDLAEALRRAQLEIMSQPAWKSPYFWAAFTLTGDPKALTFREE